MSWSVVVALAVVVSAPRAMPCDSVLGIEPEVWVDTGQCMACTDGLAEEWAACLHERSMAKLAGNAELLRNAESLHEHLLELHAAVGELVWLQCRCNGYGHVETRDRAWFERDFAHLADLYASGAAGEQSPQLRKRVEELCARILGRLNQPSRWDLGEVMVAEDEDSTAARVQWDEEALPLVQEANVYAMKRSETVTDDRASVARLEVLDGMIRRLLGAPDGRRREVERDLESAKRRRAEGR